MTHFVRKGRKGTRTDGVTVDLLDERKGHPKQQITKFVLKRVEEISSAENYELIMVPTVSIPWFVPVKSGV